MLERSSSRALNAQALECFSVRNLEQSGIRVLEHSNVEIGAQETLSTQEIPEVMPMNVDSLPLPAGVAEHLKSTFEGSRSAVIGKEFKVAVMLKCWRLWKMMKGRLEIGEICKIMIDLMFASELAEPLKQEVDNG